MRMWKWLGLAGVVGVAVVGVAVGTAAVQRSRRQYVDAPTEELAARIQERLAEAKARQAD